jgi:flagellar basal body-associated protein FliL
MVMPARRLRSIMFLAALVLAGLPVLPVAGSLTATSADAREKRPPPPNRNKLSATRYYTLAPFTLPLFDGEEVVEQMTIVIALEMADDDARPDVERIVPKIRDAMYRELFRMVSFRRKGQPLPDVDMFKARLSRAIRVVAGEKLVKSMLVQQAFERPAR